MAPRGGCPTDYICKDSYTNASDCDTFCKYLETGGLLDNSYVSPPPVAYFGRCFNASSSTPLNNRRIAFPSQLGTTDIDPDLLKMNQSNCRSIFGFFIKSYSFIKDLFRK